MHVLIMLLTLNCVVIGMTVEIELVAIIRKIEQNLFKVTEAVVDMAPTEHHGPLN